ncbi:Dual specificity phosphatase [Phytophthora palmivora]|uniref:protein-tyrosine-phosphatase n=1 Tax=Phytophthora palmivora TaxID=4796 RepID=A0A2P4YU18_9STRA|nr:Dual specificity phosphatase [Phytophthora palmivora]
MPAAPSASSSESIALATHNYATLATTPSDMSVGDETSASKSAAADVAKDETVDAACPTEEHEPVPTPTKRQVRRGEVNCRWLYNQVQAARGMILIDTRSREEYEQDSIPSALSIPPMANCRTLEDVENGLLEEQRYLFNSKKRKLRDVVLFGDAVKKTAEDASDTKSCSWLRKLERLIIEDGLVTSVKLLCDGFLTFKYRYPFYTTSALLDEMFAGQLTRTKSGTHNLNYPNEILEGFLFLGNMWHAQSKQVISHLGITHVVNASLDVGNTFDSDGVKYFNVTIKDRPEANIGQFFDGAYRFIESAKRTQHGRVLVHCTQGISRSATIVIMYLMRANNWSLVTAVNFAMASRGVVYPNQGFVKSLMVEEFRLYKGNSITSDEVDTMLQNLIPDRPHKCSYCRKAFCSKCTNTRLANPEREKSAASNGVVDEQRPRRVCQHLNVNSLSTFGRTVCISYFEGTEAQVIMDVLKIRFGVKENQIIDISRDDGEPIRTVEEIVCLPDEAEVFVSVAEDPEVAERKFRELWKLSFPSMGLIERAALLKIKRPEILMDVMLGMSSLSCGALTIQEFSQRLIELGYADSDRQAVISLLDTARRATGRVVG